MDTVATSSGADRRLPQTSTRPAFEQRQHRQSSTAPVRDSRSEGTAGSVRHIVANRPHALLGIPGTQITSDSGALGGPSKRMRKERGPNWSINEVKALIEAKRKIHEMEQKMKDGRQLMIPDAGKWQRISVIVMQASSSPCMRDGIACKCKWNQLIPEYKKIADYIKRTGTSECSFWLLSFAQHKEQGLPRSFPEDIFHRIHDWYGDKPAMLPTHGRNLMEPEDCTFHSACKGSEDVQLLDSSHDEEADDEAFAYDEADFNSAGAGMNSASTFPASSRSNPLDDEAFSSPCGTPVPAPKASVPAGVVPLVISTSETGSLVGGDRPQSTGMRRKALSDHSLIAEATTSTGNALRAQMRHAAEVTRDIEKSKIDIQIRQFEEQMAYQKDRDQRLSENARKSDENAKLSIIKHGEVVMALSAMTSVLKEAFIPRGTQLKENEDGGPSSRRSSPPQRQEEPAMPKNDPRVSDTANGISFVKEPEN